MEKKIDILQARMEAGEWGKALKIAAAFPRLGRDKDAIRKAWAAMSNPDFYKQIGVDVDAAIACGIEALKGRYNNG